MPSYNDTDLKALYGAGNSIVAICKITGLRRTSVFQRLKRANTAMRGAYPRKHGYAGKGRKRHPLYHAWQAIIGRCANPKNKRYADYGGRGIRVCSRWRASFTDFLGDVGPRPDGASLDRYPDNNGDYEPGNVRWANRVQQGRNNRRNVNITYDGKTMPVVAWAELRGCSVDALYKRVQRGQSVDSILLKGEQR